MSFAGMYIPLHPGLLHAHSNSMSAEGHSLSAEDCYLGCYFYPCN
jgi:hypothetical protein